MTYIPKAGLNHATSYVVSGVPFVTSSIIAPTGSNTPLEIVFPTVTKFVIVKNNNPASAVLRVGFSSNGIKNSKNYLTLNKDESFCGDIRLTSIFLLGDTSAVTCSVIAGLTGIEGYDLTAAYSGSEGIG